MTIGRRVLRYGKVLRHVIQGVSEMHCNICTGGGSREGRPVMGVRPLQSPVPSLYKLAVAGQRRSKDLCRLVMSSLSLEPPPFHYCSVCKKHLEFKYSLLPGYDAVSMKNRIPKIRSILFPSNSSFDTLIYRPPNQWNPHPHRCENLKTHVVFTLCYYRRRWPCDLRRGPAAARFLGMRVRIPLIKK
jgi:hypothetical protein